MSALRSLHLRSPPAAFTRITQTLRTPVARHFHASSPKMVVHMVKTNQEFQDSLKQNSVVFLDCFAEWCGPCKMISPILEKLSDLDDNKNIRFIKIDVDEVPELSQELGITAMPTFMVFKDGDKVESFVGASKPALEKLITKHRV